MSLGEIIAIHQVCQSPTLCTGRALAAVWCQLSLIFYLYPHLFWCGETTLYSTGMSPASSAFFSSWAHVVLSTTFLYAVLTAQLEGARFRMRPVQIAPLATRMFKR